MHVHTRDPVNLVAVGHPHAQFQDAVGQIVVVVIILGHIAQFTQGGQKAVTPGPVGFQVAGQFRYGQGTVFA
jgi:hypothetical protein